MRYTFFRHAVDAAEIAFLSDGDAEVVVLAGVCICEEGGERLDLVEAMVLEGFNFERWRWKRLVYG